MDYGGRGDAADGGVKSGLTPTGSCRAASYFVQD
jgi:hypothetical protein